MLKKEIQNPIILRVINLLVVKKMKTILIMKPWKSITPHLARMKSPIITMKTIDHDAIKQ